jgi:glycosyltransferase involved in cell wall biosynthesis
MKPDSHLRLPLISCLCVTKNRPKLLERAIACFNGQTYQNKQLVILYDDNDLETSNWISNNYLGNLIKIVKVSTNPKKKLGAVRNLAVEYADGEFVCQWDDDDWYHINRISLQYQMLVKNNKQGSVLTQYLMFNEKENKAYISFKRNYWEGSLMCEKRMFLERQYDNISRGEDTPFVEYLYNSNKLAKIENMANIFLYVFHGNNTWDYDHFESLFNRSQELPEFTNIIKDILAGKHSPTDSSILLDVLWAKHIQLIEE